MTSAPWQRERRPRPARAVLLTWPTDLPSPLRRWEDEHERPWRRRLGGVWASLRRPARSVLLGAVVFVLGAQLVSGPDAALASLDIRSRLMQAEMTVKARQGELELARLELARLNTIVEYSTKYRIPADLSAAIYDIALAEGIEPELAYRLVRVESGFAGQAVSPKGAVGLTQVMPATAYELAPGIGYRELFERETNLRLGFRYLRALLEKYDGNLHLALSAYNRGPGKVDSIRRVGGDPRNGYSRAVLAGPK